MISLLVAAVILVKPTVFIPTPGTAETTDAVLAELKNLNDTDNCTRQAAAGLKNKCFADMIKHLSELQEEYNDNEQTEHSAWHAENDIRGVGADFQTDHQALHDAMKAKHAEFNSVKTTLAKAYGDALKAIRASGRGQNNVSTTPVTHEEVVSLKQNTCTLDRKDAQRLCIRLQMRKAKIQEGLKSHVPAN